MILEQIIEKNNINLKRFKFYPSHGRLRTDPNLVRQKVYKIPEKAFISDDYKFLEPCAGTGTYVISVLERLLKYKSFDKAINQIYICENSRSISNAFLKNLIPKKKPFMNFKNEVLDILISEISDGEIKTLSDLSYIIYNEDIKNQIFEMKLKLTEFIERYEKVSKLESKLFGEVFTPKKLVEEMLNQLPKEVWKNKNLKWLDPAVGIGNFPSLVVEKLMDGLKDEFPSDSERYKYIMEEMIYMCDISTKNLFLLYKLFDENNGLKLNVYRGSFVSDSGDKISDGFLEFLKEKDVIDSKWVIVGNPPYNWSDGQSQRRNNRENLWTRFVVLCFDFLKEGGYLCFVTPKSWMSPSADFGRVHILKDIFAKYNPIYVNIDECSKYFDVGSSFSYYIIEKTNNKKNTLVKTSDSEFEFDFSDVEQLPTIFNELSISISKKFFNHENKFNFKQQGINTRGEQFFESPEENYTNLCYHTKSKSRLYSRFVSEDLGKKKVLICLSGLYNPIIDGDGSISQTNMNCVHLLSDNDNILNIENQLKSNLYIFIMNYLFKYNGWVNMKCVYNLPFVESELKIDDNFLYEYFNLTQSEIDLIEKTIKG